MIAGVAIDDWKLAVFHRRLKEGGFEYTKEPGLTAGTLMLKVHARSADELKPIVEAAQTECAIAKETKQ